MRRSATLLLTLVVLSTGVGGTASADHQLDCVGDPPRQTEDPLSPACGPYHGEDNGGATDDGVTGDTVTLGFYNDLGIIGDLTAPWSPDDETVGHQASYQERDLVRTVKAHVRHFASTFETYGRTVRVIARASVSGITSPCSQRQSDAARMRLDVNPFATVAFGGDMRCFAEYSARVYHRPTFVYGGDVPVAMQRRHPGLIWSFLPDIEEQARASAAFICRKLDGRLAKFTSDPTIQGRPRKLGLAYPSKSQRGDSMKESALALLRALKNRCDPPVEVETFVESGTSEAPNVMNAWRRANVTTVICYCMPVANEFTATKFQAAAAALAYFPEWYWDSTVSMDKAMWQQLFSNPQQISFGTSFFWRQRALREQYHYQAYLGQEPDTVPNTRFSWTIYHSLLQAFTAIQVAGPNLTAANVETGLRAHRVSSPDNPFTPMASYTGSDSFVESFTGWWWDRTGTPPDGRTAEGCMRLMQEGHGFAASTWPRGDADLFVKDAPCGAANQTAYP